MKKILFGLLLLLSIVLGFSACKKLIHVDAPKTQLSTDKLFSNAETANAAMAAIYSQFNSSIGLNISLFGGLYADELQTSSASQPTLEFAQSTIGVSNGVNLNIWRGLYGVIYQCNHFLEGLEEGTGMSEQAKNGFKGELLFIRAACYYYLTQLYDDVPFLTTTDVRYSSIAARMQVGTIHSRLLTDLLEAKLLLPKTYSDAERVRVNYWGACVLLSRLYLLGGNFQAAEQHATEVISSGLFSLASTTGSVFVKGSSETILQFWTQNGFTQMGVSCIPSGTALPVYLLHPKLLERFEPGDTRKSNWIKTAVINGQSYLYPFKYKNRVSTSGTNGEYFGFLRLAELYLIRSEARAMQGTLADALADLNVVRSRAGLTALSLQAGEALLAAIEQERSLELFCEWGERFIDLKRRQRLTAVLGVLKPGWKSSAALFPLPQYELLNNPNLVQNPGY
ncbi:putative outer membrane starch-binding protein [Lacibacter cauensis]|uniref:Putative outer membrane starch-binding protein n=1 Tax=Lacibacter cauensis TaxID=510947 RepID=A0A562SPP9_9BACT|nr:RagB/SusD family nutrient uptake outer membrane protein [Lacibacter cauensis]TWI83255.1 putative outer membrane starch-binding protein [Lacibacter cauensis]